MISSYIEFLIFIILFIITIIIARAQYLYGRSAFAKAGEYGGDFIPKWIYELYKNK